MSQQNNQLDQIFDSLFDRSAGANRTMQQAVDYKRIKNQALVQFKASARQAARLQYKAPSKRTA